MNEEIEGTNPAFPFSHFSQKLATNRNHKSGRVQAKVARHLSPSQVSRTSKSATRSSLQVISRETWTRRSRHLTRRTRFSTTRRAPSKTSHPSTVRLTAENPRRPARLRGRAALAAGLLRQPKERLGRGLRPPKARLLHGGVQVGKRREGDVLLLQRARGAAAEQRLRAAHLVPATAYARRCSRSLQASSRTTTRWWW